MHVGKLRHREVRIFSGCLSVQVWSIGLLQPGLWGSVEFMSVLLKIEHVDGTPLSLPYVFLGDAAWLVNCGLNFEKSVF